MEVKDQLKVIQRTLNLLSSWLHLKFHNDPSFPSSLIPESILGSVVDQVKVEQDDTEVVLEIKSSDRLCDIDHFGPTSQGSLHRCSICKLDLPSVSSLRLHETKHCFVNILRLTSDDQPKLVATREATAHERNVMGSDQAAITSLLDDTDYSLSPSPLEGNESGHTAFPSVSRNTTYATEIVPLRYKGHNQRMANRRYIRCPLCSKLYGLGNSLHKHILELHPNQATPQILASVEHATETFTCDVCHRKFKGQGRVGRYELKQHLKKQHPEAYREKVKSGELVNFSRLCKGEKRSLQSDNLSVSNHNSSVLNGTSASTTDDKTPQVTPLTSKKQSTKSQHNKTGLKLLNRQYIPCPLCERQFGIRSSLLKHIKEMHPDEEAPESLKSIPEPETFGCDICDKKFKLSGKAGRYYMKVHYRKLHPSEYKTKIESGEWVDYPWVTRKTQQEKRDVTGYENCPYCHSFLKKSFLTKHIREIHQKRRTFLCSVCDYSTPIKSKYNDHVATHQDTRNFLCHECLYASKTRVGLRNHIRNRHAPRKLWQCPKCGDMFKGSYNLKKHLENVHDNLRRFPCQHCDKAFKTKVHLEHHLKTHESSSGRQRGLHKDRQPRRRVDKTQCAPPQTEPNSFSYQ